ncbi:sulfotransferase [Rubritalea tangerina]|uniref:Sulfotransferase n=1 Tax=Rubritalea tangerina TaxID=430798 RepID=A0ABW4ZFK6_9BACT
MFPVIVLSPIVRSGSTLLQRLLCSAPNTLIYGDTVGQEIEFLANYATTRELMLRTQQATIEPVRSKVLQGDVSEFITPLSPSLAGSLKGFQDAAKTWIEVCRKESLDHGRDVWGWKMAGAEASTLARIAQWYPDAKFIWIERNLKDCLTSAKAAGMVAGKEQASAMIQRAQACKQAFTNLQANKLSLSFETILQNPASTIQQLEQFTGAMGIDPSVFDERINQFGSKSYLPPTPLTHEEEAVLTTSPQPLTV